LARALDVVDALTHRQLGQTHKHGLGQAGRDVNFGFHGDAVNADHGERI
jgi:hypothetical protein